MTLRMAVLGLLIALIPGVAHAWCERHPTVAEEYAEAEFVYVAFVETARILPADWGENFHSVEYTVRPLDVFKGDPPESLTLWSENSTARFPMRVTGTYLIFVRPEHPIGWQGEHLGRALSNCGNSFEMAGMTLGIAPAASADTLDGALLLDTRLSGLAERARDCALLSTAPTDPTGAEHWRTVTWQLRCDSLVGDAVELRRRFDGYPVVIEVLDDIGVD